MKQVKKKVLVVATSSKTRGGITSVINSHKNTSFWNHWNCIWTATNLKFNNYDKEEKHK